MQSLSVATSPSPLNAAFTVFKLKGHLDAVTLTELEKHFKSSLELGCFKWVVDLSQLEYISSAGIGSFVGALSELRNNGGDLWVVGASAKIGRILRVLGFEKVFRVFGNESEAFGSPGLAQDAEADGILASGLLED
jgi:anti-sigma B factor antagonist